VFAWMRKGRAPDARCLVVMNFTPEVRRDYRVKVPFEGSWREILNTDSSIYGGSNVGNAGLVVTAAGSNGAELSLTLPPLATLFLIPELAA
jgi:1,4-alpha-glucan branching enzyme